VYPVGLTYIYYDRSFIFSSVTVSKTIPFLSPLSIWC